MKSPFLILIYQYTCLSLMKDSKLLKELKNKITETKCIYSVETGSLIVKNKKEEPIAIPLLFLLFTSRQSLTLD